MLRIDILTIFPSFFDSFLAESLIAKALRKKIIRIRIHDLRSFARDKHKTVDDRPYGGGVGMLLKIEPIARALSSIKKKKRTRVILLTPGGRQFNQRIAASFSNKTDHLILICGRYEGIDARIKHFIDDELSVGPYVLNGGEVAAMVLIEAVFRLIPGALGNSSSLTEESHVQHGIAEYPQYTRPETFHGWRAPRVLLSGDHSKIKLWRKRHQRRAPG